MYLLFLLNEKTAQFFINHEKNDLPVPLPGRSFTIISNIKIFFYYIFIVYLIPLFGSTKKFSTMKLTSPPLMPSFNLTVMV